ncbi:hypothetical protein UFOVP760_291 [uncultured Caudovirales phage]|uniref:Uncharacterized protein n=1 Tax=uncultured Caudovirales phage TaxID=2100421 RepID=A0A6J7XFA1_9CAUD|nr:hypothetical protein UFOVP760_291 [uncultured Caudovirales phage]
MFDLFPKKKSVDEILETNEALYESVKKEDSNLASGLVDGVYEIIALKNELQHQLDENAKLNLQITALHKIIEGGKQSIDDLKKDVEGQQQLKDSLHRVNEKYIQKVTEQADRIILLENAIERWHSRANEWEKLDKELKSSVSELTKEVIGLRHLKTENVELIEKLKKETQKHPMYPLHWGGYDGAASTYPKQYSDWLHEQKEKYDKNIIDFVESEFSNEDPVEGKQVEFNPEELLKRVTEYADTLDSLPKSFPDEFQDEKTTADNLEERFDAGENVLDYFATPWSEPKWKCPCNKCKEAKTEKSWEEAASDLALKVAKLEKKIEELTIIKITSDPNYKYFLKNGK